MEIKLLEVRDCGTFIPVMAVRFGGGEHGLLRAAGYGADQHYAILTRLTDGQSMNDPYKWPNRTMREAHIHIERSWNILQDGSVVDVEFVLGETAKEKTSDLALQTD